MNSENTSAATPDPKKVRRGRWMLIALFALFFGPIFLALVLGWFNIHPSGTKNKGEWLKPYADLTAVTPRLADGTEYHWNPEQRMWRIVLAPPAGFCEGAGAASCVKLAQDLDKVWQLFGHNADHAQILWIGALPPGVPQSPSLKVLQPDAALLSGLPRVNDPAGIPVYIIDPNGFVIMRYAPGFDLAHLRSDLAKLLKLA